MAESKTESTRKSHYDVRSASQTYSNIAAVLAGFAFAAVVLVVQIPTLLNNANAPILRDRATIALLIAFFGCVAAAFTFGVVAGEEKLALRSHAIALCGGTGFSLSSGYIFWGLASLIKLFLSPSIAELSRWISSVSFPSPHSILSFQ
ncbi:MAG TPA: hypothetical protein ENN22_04265 [bacterium]|nr:hypothetical protein [bacterium]